MSGRSQPSRLELVRRQRRDSFVGRGHELELFRENLARAPEDAAQFLFHVRGPAGVGKSTLISQWEAAAREQRAVTARVDETATGVAEAMETISAQLTHQGASMNGLDDLLKNYRDRQYEAQVAASAESGPEGAADPGQSQPSAASTVTAQVLLGTLGAVPGLGPVAGAIDPSQAAMMPDRIRQAWANGRLRNQSDAQLVLQPLQTLAPVFLKHINKAAEKASWVTIFFDAYERTGPTLDVWLRDTLFSDRYGELAANVIVVLAGQGRLETRCWGDQLAFITDLPLDIFTEAEARQLLAAKGVDDERVMEVVLHLSRRLPVLVSMLADGRPASGEEVGDPSGTAVERFLKWETDPVRRGVALACALPQELNEDICRTVVGAEGAELFDWLRTLPFVQDSSGRCRYHDVVRTAMLRLQRIQSPSRWQAQHGNLANAFAGWQAQLEDNDGKTDEERWRSQRWRDLHLQATYHRLCGDERAGLVAAVRALVHAYVTADSEFRRWVLMVGAAGDDADARAVRDLAKRLLGTLEGEAADDGGALNVLLGRAELDTETKALAYTLRAKRWVIVGTLDRALADYDAAIALTPEWERAYRGRSEVHQLAGRSAQAMADADRAVELCPDEPSPLVSRAMLHLHVARHDEARRDMARATELDADHIDTAMGRMLLQAMDGDVHRTLDELVVLLRGSSEEIPDELSTAILAAQDGRVDDAKAALDVLEKKFAPEVRTALDGVRSPSLVGLAGRVASGRDDVIAGNPELHMMRVRRAQEHFLADRHDEALRDLDHVLEHVPDFGQALLTRGAVHAQLENYTASLRDLNAGINRTSGQLDAFLARGRVLAYTGRLDDAEADCDVYLHTYNRHADALGLRADIRKQLGRHEEAIADYTLALRSDSASADLLTGRARTFLLMGRFQEALSDAGKAAWLDGAEGLPRYLKALALRATGKARWSQVLAEAVALYEADTASDDENHAATGTGNLFLCACTAGEWVDAWRPFEEFLRRGTSVRLLRDAAMAMRELVAALPETEERMADFRTRLDEVLAARQS
ncbi:hypothetical protein [Streptomyces sp. NPDC047525]|uniref:hypothetical protein n=1 Tax=Streptomyces sp. NPDC047525 TaxID=3155264 RepID=UPI0033D780B2